MSKRWLVGGFVCCALSLLLPPLGLVAIIIGIVALVQGRLAAGVVLSIVLPFVGTIVVQAFFVKPYRIPSEAMVPTLEIGDRLLVWRGGGQPHRGDVVVFHPPAGAESETECGARPAPRQPCPKPTPRKADVNFIKRIVAAPGDRLAIEDGHVILNGTRAREPYTQASGGGPHCDFPKAITVPPDHYFMMG